ncbi:2,3,4,5-tetrahydropyridine-2,6-dicarboxylate N-succinyltransferase [Desulfurispira natronophila]|uniref:2,3,4,5-tetrahydropyridine-2-carboxylate N-succinyltransferase n=1 Tax=Desulfurispira natronophila TaxID=682562 RepID=A0A7W8DHN2_9BACT|nr:2,3,4,5-tetrahydropyridine-2,6-dicarboxylate N-succinyltransferase [Desulfurispira natronophila]MBB5022473.1 2,3,4,5-tetrahydropyridine-2-carboxylate N-succinyltransferase [Desulfurispira natronophila]
MDFARAERMIDEAFANRELLKDAAYAQVVRETIDALDKGALRVAEPEANGNWKVNSWAKQAILLYFPIAAMETIEVGPYEYHDKIPLKKGYQQAGVRVVPPATVRYGAHVEAGAVLMPSYINIGGYVSAGSMIDTWATVGSCAQVGRDVHISGGAGLGGVLEPPSAQPVIVDDGAFVGSRCIIVEGVHVEKEAVLGANVTLTASTPIIDVTGSEPITLKGRVPARSVVVPGTTMKEFPAGQYGMPCALIIGQRKESTDKKTSLNDVLREFNVPV